MLSTVEGCWAGLGIVEPVLVHAIYGSVWLDRPQHESHAPILDRLLLRRLEATRPGRFDGRRKGLSARLWRNKPERPYTCRLIRFVVVLTRIHPMYHYPTFIKAHSNTVVPPEARHYLLLSFSLQSLGHTSSNPYCPVNDCVWFTAPSTRTPSHATVLPLPVLSHSWCSV